MRRLALSSALLLPLAACQWLLPFDQVPGSKDRAIGDAVSLDRPVSRDLDHKPDRSVDRLILREGPSADTKPTPDLLKCGPNEVIKGGSCVCPGCREASGACQPGTALAACGTGGGFCADCTQNPCLKNTACTAAKCVGVNSTGTCPGGICVSGTCCTGCVDLGSGACQLNPSDSQCGCGGTTCQDCTKSGGSFCGPGNCLQISCI